MSLTFFAAPTTILICFYFTSLLLLTVLKSFLTVRGLFFIFIIILFFLLLSLLCSFDSIFLHNQTFSYDFILTEQISLLPELGLSFHLDSLSYCFMLLVILIGFFTNIYILNYFKFEANEDSFYLLINWFIISMLCLVLADNLFTLFLGWELIGLTSFFLINFWNERRGTLKSSFKAFSFNKFSDFFLLIFLILLWNKTSISNIFLINFILETTTITVDSTWYLAGFSLLICSSIKSAQLFGHLWLPDSMEAPVPASALIHSATLVSAGLYLLLRFNVLLSLLDLHFIIFFLGSITAAYGGIVAAAQTDVKKLLAYSTISHCGFLYVCVSLQNYYLVIIYLFLHGIFKALTFFCVGSFIRVANSQDTRQMGILSRYLPVDTIFLILCSSNLGGLPFTLGYFYKSVFLTTLVNSTSTILCVGLCFIGMLTSIIYVFRLVYYCAFDINKSTVTLSTVDLKLNIHNIKNNFSLTTIVQCITIFGLLLLSIYIYILLINYFQFSNIEIEAFPLFFSSEENYIFNSELLYNFYINFFYIIYILIIFIIIIVEGRQTFTWDKKFWFIFLLITFIFNLLFFFICYVRTNYSRSIFTTKL